MIVEKPFFPRGNAYHFTLVFLIVFIILLVLVFGNSMIMFQAGSIPGLSLGLFVPLLMAMPLGLLHLMWSMPRATQKNFSYSSARANLARVGVLIITFTTVGAIALQSHAYVLAQPTPSESHLYLEGGFTMHANSSTLPTVTTRTWEIQKGEVDDLMVHVEGIATAPCGTDATIDFSVGITFNSGAVWIYPERRSSTGQAHCGDGDQSKAALELKWSGFPIDEMENVSITLTMFPHPENADTFLTVTIDKINDVNLLYWNKQDSSWVFGSTAVMSLGYAGFATIILATGLNRLRSWQKNDVRLFKESVKVWSRDDP
ncbi:MAG: hypothetical protein JW839_10075 [Candidatus Lokiarchaeota archaeon]|nr:hypothetical protein [Candidatus Lokiarchaeota archaeon]